jgi:hypothetical protein
MDITVMVEANLLHILTNILVVLLLWGCTSAPAWQISHQKGSQKEFDSARLSYPVRDRVNGLAVEMIYAKKSFRTYLEVHSQMIPPYQGNPKDAFVKLKTSDKTLQGIAHRHQGGQRVTLTPELQKALVDTLLSGSPVTIELVGYSTTLQPEEFTLSYQKMQNKPLNIPIQLPFKL